MVVSNNFTTEYIHIGTVCKDCGRPILIEIGMQFDSQCSKEKHDKFVNDITGKLQRWMNIKSFPYEFYTSCPVCLSENFDRVKSRLFDSYRDAREWAISMLREKASGDLHAVKRTSLFSTNYTESYEECDIDAPGAEMLVELPAQICTMQCDVPSSVLLEFYTNKCPKCGYPATGKQRFCTFCGSKLI